MLYANLDGDKKSRNINGLLEWVRGFIWIRRRGCLFFVQFA